MHKFTVVFTQTDVICVAAHVEKTRRDRISSYFLEELEPTIGLKFRLWTVFLFSGRRRLSFMFLFSYSSTRSVRNTKPRSITRLRFVFYQLWPPTGTRKLYRCFLGDVSDRRSIFVSFSESRQFKHQAGRVVFYSWCTNPTKPNQQRWFRLKISEGFVASFHMTPRNQETASVA